MKRHLVTSHHVQWESKGKMGAGNISLMPLCSHHISKPSTPKESLSVNYSVPDANPSSFEKAAASDNSDDYGNGHCLCVAI